MRSQSKPSHPKPRARKAYTAADVRKAEEKGFIRGHAAGLANRRVCYPVGRKMLGMDIGVIVENGGEIIVYKRGREMVWEDLEQPLRGRDIAPAGEIERYMREHALEEANLMIRSGRWRVQMWSGDKEIKPPPPSLWERVKRWARFASSNNRT